MSTVARLFPLLDRFFGTQLHQDWDLNADDVQEAFEQYLRRLDQRRGRLLQDELSRFAELDTPSGWDHEWIAPSLPLVDKDLPTALSQYVNYMRARLRWLLATFDERWPVLAREADAGSSDAVDLRPDSGRYDFVRDYVRGYFHQGWDEEFETVRIAYSYFGWDSTEDELRQTLRELLEFRRETPKRQRDLFLAFGGADVGDEVLRQWLTALLKELVWVVTVFDSRDAAVLGAEQGS